MDRARYVSEDYAYQTRKDIEKLSQDLRYLQEEITIYDTNGQALSDNLVRAAERSYESGELGFYEFIQMIEQSKLIRASYLKTLSSFHEKRTTLKFLTNE